MEKENYRDFAGDEKLAELQDKLNEAKIKSEHHKALEEQSKANLNLFEKITTDSAIKLAECQSHLTDLTQRLDEEKAELARQTDLMTQQEMINKAKAYTERAGRKSAALLQNHRNRQQNSKQNSPIRGFHRKSGNTSQIRLQQLAA